MAVRRTYWHLEPLARKPSAYEVATSRLLYFDPAAKLGRNGLEVRTPAAEWMEQHQRRSALQSTDWERFQDPRQTTYASYTELQRARELYIDGLFQSMENTGYDSELRPEWIATLDQILPVLRFPLHGLQMVSAYIGHLAPSGRIVVTALMQTGDEVRRIQRMAYRMRALQSVRAEFGAHSRQIWESDPRWQPLRELIEQLLVTYDWGEAFVALNSSVKPVFDDRFTVQLARLAEKHGDPLLGRMLFSLQEDCRWHREWSGALLEMLELEAPANRDAISRWRDLWTTRIVTALAPLTAAYFA